MNSCAGCPTYTLSRGAPSTSLGTSPDANKVYQKKINIQYLNFAGPTFISATIPKAFRTRRTKLMLQYLFFCVKIHPANKRACAFSRFFNRVEMSPSWSRARDWKSRKPHHGFGSSNPPISAKNRAGSKTAVRSVFFSNNGGFELERVSALSKSSGG